MNVIDLRSLPDSSIRQPDPPPTSSEPRAHSPALPADAFEPGEYQGLLYDFRRKHVAGRSALLKPAGLNRWRNSLDAKVRMAVTNTNFADAEASLTVKAPNVPSAGNLIFQLACRISASSLDSPPQLLDLSSFGIDGVTGRCLNKPFALFVEKPCITM